MSTIHFLSVRIHTTTLRRKFDDAQIFLEALDERCGTGTFILDDPKLFTPKGCPDIAATKTKKPMGRADIYWRAPKCGCVNIRYDAVILMYYFDVTFVLLRVTCINLLIRIIIHQLCFDNIRDSIHKNMHELPGL